MAHFVTLALGSCCDKDYVFRAISCSSDNFVMFKLVKVCFANSMNKRKCSCKGECIMPIVYVKYMIRHLILWVHPSNKTTIKSDKPNTPGETAGIFVPVNYSLTKR